MNLYLLVFVFLDFELFMIINEIVDFPSVDLIHWNCNSEVSIVLLEIVNTSIE